MPPTSTYIVFQMESPILASQLAAYKALRLTSLQVDPHAFSSTYAREVAFTEDVWRERLDARFKQTFVASVVDKDASHDSNDARDMAGEWIGTAGVIGPTAMTPFLTPLKEAGVDANWQVYGLFAMWVHPEHRGKGVGAQLVKACLEWARTNIDTAYEGGAFEKVMMLLVYDNNVAGRALYSRIGFTDLEEVPAEEGKRWMMAKVSGAFQSWDQ